MRQETSSWGFVLEIFVARWDFFGRKFRKAWKYFLKKKSLRRNCGTGELFLGEKDSNLFFAI